MLLLLSIACLSENQLHADQERPPEPSIAVTSPASGSWLAEGTAEVQGSFANLYQLDVNDSTVTPNPAEGTFASTIELRRGINTIQAYGETQDGEGWRYDRVAVLAGDYADPGYPVEDAVGIRLNQSGLDAAVDFVAGMVDDETVAETAMGMNPIYEDSYGVLGWDAVDIEARIDDLTFDDLRIAATPSEDELELRVVIPDLFVDLQAVGEIVWIDFDVDASIWADQAVITLGLGVDTDDGDLVVDLLSSEVDLVGFGYDTSLLPGDVESYLFVSTISEKLEGMLLEQTEEQVPPLLASTLGDLDLSTELELMDTPVSLAATFASASIDDDGIQLFADVDVHSPTSGSHTYAGYLSAPVDLAVDHDAALSMAMGDDILNRLFFELWKGGLMDISLSTDDGTMKPEFLAGLKAEEGTVTLNPLLPPVLVQHDEGMEVQIGACEVTVSTPGGDLGERLVADLSITIHAALAYSDGKVVLELTDPQMDLMVKESDWGAMPETVTQILEQLIPVGELTSALGDIAIDVPEMDGIAIDGATVKRDDSRLGTHVEVDLD